MGAPTGKDLRQGAERVLWEAREIGKSLGLNSQEAALVMLGNAYAVAIVEAAGPGATLDRVTEGMQIAADILSVSVGAAYYADLISRKAKK